MQVSPFLRRGTDFYSHWCPGCLEPHIIDDTWAFDGNLNSPTFTPSICITGVQRVVAQGKWTGEWKKDEAGNPLPYCCHYILTAGKLAFCVDCTHDLKGQTVDLPELPDHAVDKEQQT